MGGNLMSNEKISQVIDDLYSKIHLLSVIQNVLMEHIADDNQELQMKIMATAFSVDKFRDNFTEFAFKEINNDDLKIFVTEMNMIADEFKALKKEEE